MTQPLCVALLALLTVGCQKAPAQSANQSAQSVATSPAVAEEATSGADATQADPPKPVPAELPDVVARVNGEAISRTDFEQALKNVEGRAGGPIPAERRDEILREVLDQLVTIHVLEQEAKTRSVTVSDSEVDAQIAEIRKQFQTEEEFTKALGERGLTLARLREDARREMAIARMVEAEVRPKIDVKEQDVKSFYDQNPDQFQQPETIRASHILLRADQAAPESDKQATRAKANDVLKEIRAGADFAEMAKKYSQDGSASNGGDLNYFQRGQMVAPFEEAALALKPGQVSDVVETQFGYHIIKLTDRQPPRTVPLDQVAQRIGEFLLMRAQQERANEFIMALRAKSKIEVLM